MKVNQLFVLIFFLTYLVAKYSNSTDTLFDLVTGFIDDSTFNVNT